MKIYHVINSLRLGGAEKLVSDLLVQFSLFEGVELTLIIIDGVNTPLKRKLEERDDLTIHNLGGSLYSPLILFRLIRLLKKADVIHAHLFPTLYWVIIAHWMLLSKSKLFYTEHSTNNNRRDKSVFKFLDRIIYSRIDKIACISDSTRINLLHHIGKKFKNRCVIINNGVDLQTLKNAKPCQKSELGFNEEDVFLIQIASFRAAKDQETVIKTLAQLPHYIKLLLIGEGPNLESCLSLVSNLGLEDRVKFLGLRSDVASLIKMSDVVIVSSNYEGFGIAAVEGMACGKPIIATDVPGLSEIVCEYGVLFERGNVTELHNRVMDLIENKNLYIEVSNRCLLRSDDFDINKVAKMYFNLYKDEKFFVI